MGKFEHISIDAAHLMMSQSEVQVVDIRDDQSWAAGRIAGAYHLTNTTLQDFVREGDPDLPLIVYCYHGNSSQSATVYLNEQGFDEVYSMDGGFEQWRAQYAMETAF